MTAMTGTGPYRVILQASANSFRNKKKSKVVDDELNRVLQTLFSHQLELGWVHERVKSTESCAAAFLNNVI